MNDDDSNEKGNWNQYGTLIPNIKIKPSKHLLNQHFFICQSHARHTMHTFLFINDTIKRQ